MHATCVNICHNFKKSFFLRDSPNLLQIKALEQKQTLAFPLLLYRHRKIIKRRKAMTLIKFEPLREFDTIHDRIQRYFDDFTSHGFNISDSFSPRIDIAEEKNQIIVTAEIPGVKKENIKITLQDNILTVEGEKKKEFEQKDKNCYRSERVFGSFKRSFTLPAEVDSENVDAKFENGILSVVLKKLEAKIQSEKVIELK